MALTPAQVLDAAADWIAADPARWGRNYFRDDDGCRCAAGAIAYVLDPHDDEGNPTTLRDPDLCELGVYSTHVLAGYLNDHTGAPMADDAVEVVADANDADGTTAGDVITWLRGAAGEWRDREAARLARRAAA